MIYRNTFFIGIAVVLLIALGCRRDSPHKIVKSTIKNESFFEQTMIVNSSCDNTVEGDLLIIKRINGDTLYLNDLPTCLKNTDLPKWTLGWGMDIKYYDNGSENLSEIISMDFTKKYVIIGKQIKGYKKAIISQPVAFWNIKPSNFIHFKKEPLTYQKSFPKNWKNKSIIISKIVFDSLSQNYVMLLNEVDSDTLAVYAMKSANLIDWEPINEGKVIYNAMDFGWGKLKSSDYNHYSSFLTDLIYFKGVWNYAFTTITDEGKRNISIYQSEQLLSKDIKLISKNIVSNQRHWKCCGAYIPKFARFQNYVIMFYTGRNDDRFESIGFMVSKDMKKWESSRRRLHFGNRGWRSDLRCSEVAMAEVKSDTIFLYVQGSKLPNIGLWKRFITKTEYKYLTGNVLDSEIGMFISVDGGITFKANSKNPIFINDFSSQYEDDHLGMSLDIIKKNDTTFLFYTAKGQKGGIYQPFVKFRVK
ncbi:MAG: hypothetical protein WCK02_15205 [Bacteroidota bacterium]